MDGRTGLTPQDKVCRPFAPKSASRLFTVNKGEGGDRYRTCRRVYELALGEPHVISGAHGDGVYYLIEEILENFPSLKPKKPMQTSRFCRYRSSERRQIYAG